MWDLFVDGSIVEELSLSSGDDKRTGFLPFICVLSEVQVKIVRSYF